MVISGEIFWSEFEGQSRKRMFVKKYERNWRKGVMDASKD